MNDTGAPGSGKPVMLLVDDEISIREVVAEYLEMAGYAVAQASSGQEALDMLGVMPSISLVITDVRMPGMSGLDLIERCRTRHADVRFIVVSGYFPPRNLSQPFLKKPFTLEALLDAVAAGLARTA